MTGPARSPLDDLRAAQALLLDQCGPPAPDSQLVVTIAPGVLPEQLPTLAGLPLRARAWMDDDRALICQAEIADLIDRHFADTIADVGPYAPPAPPVFDWDDFRAGLLRARAEIPLVNPRSFVTFTDC